MDGTWLVGLLVVFVATPVAIASYVSAVRSSAAQQLPQQRATGGRHGLTPRPRIGPQRRYHGRRVAGKLARNAVTPARHSASPTRVRQQQT